MDLIYSDFFKESNYHVRWGKFVYVLFGSFPKLFSVYGKCPHWRQHPWQTPWFSSCSIAASFTVILSIKVHSKISSGCLKSQVVLNSQVVNYLLSGVKNKISCHPAPSSHQGCLLPLCPHYPHSVCYPLTSHLVAISVIWSTIQVSQCCVQVILIAT